MRVVLVVGPRGCGKGSVACGTVMYNADAALCLPFGDLGIFDDDAFPHVILPEGERSDQALEDAMSQLSLHGSIAVWVDHDEDLARDVIATLGDRIVVLVVETQFVGGPHRAILAHADEVMLRADKADPQTKVALQEEGLSYDGDEIKWQRWTRANV